MLNKMTVKTLVMMLVFASASSVAVSQKRAASLDAEALQTMKKATTFMVEKVSYNGGFLWNYAPDFSRVWGELEAKPTMMWIEPPGTPAMGHLFLDAYHATGDEYYFKAAEAAAKALIWGQLECGGWAYMVDFAGEASLKDWYKQVYDGYDWPAYEHQYYYGNATFDDGGTIMAAELLLRMYLENYDPVYKPALDKAIDFVLESQYPIGGWPQRYPLRYDHPDNGQADYSSFITINDGVHTNNINFLIACYQTLGEQRVLEPISRAMTCILALQGGKPQSGWGLQHSLDMDYTPAHARPFEPAGYASHGTAEMIEDLMYFYRLTGDTKYLARIPDAFEWLESIAIPQSDYRWIEERRLPKKEGQILCPTFVEKGTNKGLYLHRTPGDIRTGHYVVDYDMTTPLITHYSSVRTVDLARLKEAYNKLLNTPVEEMLKSSPLKSTELVEFPKYYSQWTNGEPTDENVKDIVAQLKNKEYWPGGLPGVSSEYVGFGPDRLPDEVISSWSYIRNMTTLINYLQNKK